MPLATMSQPPQTETEMPATTDPSVQPAPVAPGPTAGMRAGQRLTQTHKAMKSALPVAKAALQLFSTMTDAFGDFTEQAQPHSAKPSKGQRGQKGQPATFGGYSFLDHLFTLVHHAVMALVLILSVGALTALAFIAPPISTTIVLTALILLALWAAEIASRR